MKKVFFISVVISLCLLQVTALNYFRFFSVKPDLLLLSVVFACLYFEPSVSLALVIMIGVFKDIFGAGPFGINTLLFPFLYYLFRVLSRKIDIENNLFLCALVFFIVVVNGILNQVIFTLWGAIIPWYVSLRTIIIESVYTTALFPVLFKFLAPRLVTQNEEDELLPREEEC